ncbi:MAG: Rieske (2Fe-2S) protein [Proteobacteria bacterium]|nr:Rieske (2Fe-2S) protein [Pseudomonadota bacterium]
MRVTEQQWYPVLESRELKRKSLGVERFEWRLVFWRLSNGQAHAHLDRCPHLGAALSGGKVQNNRLTCPFHGFAFDGTGLCKHIPSLGRAGNIPKGITLTSFPLQKQHQFI